LSSSRGQAVSRTFRATATPIATRIRMMSSFFIGHPSADGRGGSS
jgi:hypothetical protein